ncbi:hypothetical protein QQF64_014660 [Cirrhinus molitorella]|uniref:Uncharacterized protein n=1 Tax=Cirrhinus molitorella TaxID=172907 RepID=A0ABR3NU36_9TELE
MSAEKEGEKDRGEAKRKAESMEQPKTKHRQQTYRTEWEKDPSFAGWLRPLSGNDGKAFCRCCNVHMVAEITVLKNHEKSKKHQDKKKNLAPAQRSIAHLLQKPSEKCRDKANRVHGRAQHSITDLRPFDQWLEARLTAAENIFHSLNDESLHLYYYFLEWVLPKFTDLNQYFQSEKVVITSLKNKIDINNGPKLRLNTLYLGVKVMQHVQQANIPVAILTDFHVRCQNFLRVVCGEIRERFDFDDALLTQIALRITFLKEQKVTGPYLEKGNLWTFYMLCSELEDLSWRLRNWL